MGVGTRLRVECRSIVRRLGAKVGVVLGVESVLGEGERIGICLSGERVWEGGELERRERDDGFDAIDQFVVFAFSCSCCT